MTFLEIIVGIAVWYVDLYILGKGYDEIMK